MNPDNNQTPTPHSSAGLPAMPVPALQGGAVPLQASASTATATNLVEAVSGQAKSLVAQYQHDPFRLAGALQQLKSQYLADQFHITTKTVDE